MGDYNIVPWAPEINELKEKTGLNDSRKGLCLTYPAWFSLARIPIDYILYSPEFICTDFHTISGTHSDHFGISGNYYLNKNVRLSSVNCR